MARYFFDVETGGGADPDEDGTELTDHSTIPGLAINLALEIAREALPLLGRVHVTVRLDGGGLIFRSAVTIGGDWLVKAD